MKTKWYNNSIDEKLIHENEPIPEGYVKGRLQRGPKKIDILQQRISKEQLYNEYIIQNQPYQDLVKKYNIKDGELRLLLNSYGIKKSQTMSAKYKKINRTHESYIAGGKKSSITQKQSWSNKSQEEKDNWSQKCKEVELNLSIEKKAKKSQDYRDWWFGLSEDERLEINKKRSSTLKDFWDECKEETLARMKATEKENRKDRLCRSVAEQKMFDTIVQYYPDVIYDVMVDQRYPYYCDFYIPSEDLFIELNAHPSHGSKPISMMSVDEYSQYKSDWVDVFARRDVEKYNRAIKEQLNYIRIYPQATLEENKIINNNHELVELLYNSQK